MRVPVRFGSLIPALLIGSTSSAAAPLVPDDTLRDAWTDGSDRDFDFWLGTWDVLLRIRQDDGSWLDARHAEAKIYRVLGGKAVLELWDEKAEGPAIRGFSLRHFDHDAAEWVLYLNWPGSNRSGISSLTGRFRHGRGEFFSRRMGPDGATTISRYTFSDIAPDRLRWDDAFSTDGGETWRNNWIMEFDRTGDRARWPPLGEVAHTFHDGTRCDRPEFRAFEPLAGRWRGTVELGIGDDRRTGDASLVAYRILDGCAVLSFLTTDVAGEHVEELGFHSFNTYVEVLEEAHLDDRPGTGLRSLFGSAEGDTLVLAAPRDRDATEQRRWIFDGRSALRLEVETLDGDARRRVLAASFERIE